MQDKLNELKARLQEVHDLQKANAVLNWDQLVNMPPGGAAARGQQLSTLSRLAQEKFIDPAIGRLLDALEPYAAGLPEDSDEARLLLVTRREYERATRIPPAFIAAYSDHSAQSYQVWSEARPANDFARVQPLLEKNLEYSRQMAEFFPGYDHIIDPLIDFADYGMKAAALSALFARLRSQLVPLVQAITAQPAADDSCLRGYFPQAGQLAASREAAAALGFDFNRGLLALTPHPFETSFATGDVRINTRVKEDYLGECLYSTIHEAGHGMYEQGVRTELDNSPLAGGTSSGAHESQSRLWENQVGRSREFCEYFLPRLQAHFPGQLDDVSVDTFYRAVNKVQRSLIRTDADEVTYNLHVMLRFDFEMALLEGRLAVKDLPEAWRERFQADFGILPPDDRDGVLQDVHWFAGPIGGAFQGYTLGNVLAAQFFQAAQQAHPQIPAEITQGRFSTLHGWLKDNIYQHGAKFTAAELVQRATGGPVRIEPYIDYLKTKYGALYGF
ncbi:MAG: carboxypeptidase M32 [Chloroflexota bacterium]